MKSRELFKRFVEMFPSMGEEASRYTPNGNYSIRVETSGKRYYVFYYADDRDWSLQTYKRYVNNGYKN